MAVLLAMVVAPSKALMVGVIAVVTWHNNMVVPLEAVVRGVVVDGVNACAFNAPAVYTA